MSFFFNSKFQPDIIFVQKLEQKIKRRTGMESTINNSAIENFVEYLFDENIQLTGITEYGISWQDIINGKAKIPEHGARFDLAFEGNVNGDRLKGTIKGVDYLEVRSDGKFMLNIYAALITDDGEAIAVKENGIAAPDSSGTSKLYLNMEFLTASQKYDWLNKKQVWVTGEVNMLNGQVNVSGYSS
jgi:hypothetical protein